MISHHMTPISDNYISYVPYSSPCPIHLANKSSIDAIREGTVKFFTIIDDVK